MYRICGLRIVIFKTVHCRASSHQNVTCQHVANMTTQNNLGKFPVHFNSLNKCSFETKMYDLVSSTAYKFELKILTSSDICGERIVTYFSRITKYLNLKRIITIPEVKIRDEFHHGARKSFLIKRYSAMRTLARSNSV